MLFLFLTGGGARSRSLRATGLGKNDSTACNIPSGARSL